MKKLIPDIFDDVFGPVMQPGSSSHTAGPCRIGYLANSLLHEKPKKIRVLLDEKGSFAGTFGHMNEDIGMLAGAYGLLPDDERMFGIKEILLSEGIEYGFEYTDLQNKHPNAVRFILAGESGKEHVLEGNSIGGGRVEIVETDGIKVSWFADRYLYISRKPLNFTKTVKTTRCKSPENEDLLISRSFEDLPWAEDVLIKLCPITETMKRGEAKPLFDSFSGWARISRDTNRNLFETAVEYETQLLGLGREEVLARMEERRRLMEKETDAPYENPEKILETPFSGYHFRKWDRYTKSNRSIQSDLNVRILKYVFATQALTKGVKLVPGPMGTGGGFLYSVVRAVAEEKGIDHDRIDQSLFVAGAVGLIAYHRSDPTGEITGCAGECGICMAMTAAAVTYLLGGNETEIENAASLSLQAALGWPCDPIPGGNNQPCFSRFVTAAIMAVTFADLAMSGRSATVPFDEAVDVMDAMGKEMSSGLKCTSTGGICATKCAGECKKNFENRFYKETENMKNEQTV